MLEEHSSSTSTAEIALFAQTLLGEQIVRPTCAGIDPTLTELARRQWEQAQHVRDQALLSRLLAQFKRKSRRCKRCARIFGLSGMTSLALALPILMENSDQQPLLIPFLISSAVTLSSAMIGTLLHRDMTNLVAHVPASDVRAIGPLLETLHYADMEGIPQRLLKELLPQVTSADAVLFTEAQRHAFCRALDDSNTDLVVMLLKTLEKIGDGRAISAVRRLADGGGRAQIDEQVLYAAQHCLPVLEARSVHDAASQILLRASHLPSGGSADLLRAAEEQDDAKPYELLRPAPFASSSSQNAE